MVRKGHRLHRVKGGASKSAGDTNPECDTHPYYLFEREDGSFVESPYIWVYTQEFAERFGMPERWIDEELEGAEAIAHQHYWHYRNCLYEDEECAIWGSYLVNVFIKSSPHTPWHNDLPLNFDISERKYSVSYLEPISLADFFVPKTQFRWNTEDGIISIASYKTSKKSVQGTRGGRIIGNFMENHAGYIKGVYPGLDWVRLGSFMTFRGGADFGDWWILFGKKGVDDRDCCRDVDRIDPQGNTPMGIRIPKDFDRHRYDAVPWPLRCTIGRTWNTPDPERFRTRYVDESSE